MAKPDMLSRMTQVMISLPEALNAQVESRAKAGGFASKEEYLLDLVRSHCEQAELESVLESRVDGPFSPLEADWKQKVRDAAQRRG
jgi:metal-responsive CopG/Arc/MetJ family transcriptional regulator